MSRRAKSRFRSWIRDRQRCVRNVLTWSNTSSPSPPHSRCEHPGGGRCYNYRLVSFAALLRHLRSGQLYLAVSLLSWQYNMSLSANIPFPSSTGDAPTSSPESDKHKVTNIVATILPVVVIVTIVVWGLLFAAGLVRYRSSRLTPSPEPSLSSSAYSEKSAMTQEEPKMWEVYLKPGEPTNVFVRMLFYRIYSVIHQWGSRCPSSFVTRYSQTELTERTLNARTSKVNGGMFACWTDWLKSSIISTDECCRLITLILLWSQGPHEPRSSSRCLRNALVHLQQRNIALGRAMFSTRRKPRR